MRVRCIQPIPGILEGEYEIAADMSNEWGILLGDEVWYFPKSMFEVVI